MSYCKMSSQYKNFAFPGDSSTAYIDQFATQNGWVKMVVIDVSDLPGTVTATFTITADSGFVVYNSGAITGGTAIQRVGDISTDIGEFPTDLKYVIRCTLSAALAAAQTAYIELFYKH